MPFIFAEWLPFLWTCWDKVLATDVHGTYLSLLCIDAHMLSGYNKHDASKTIPVYTQHDYCVTPTNKPQAYGCCCELVLFQCAAMMVSALLESRIVLAAAAAGPIRAQEEP